MDLHLTPDPGPELPSHDTLSLDQTEVKGIRAAPLQPHQFLIHLIRLFIIEIFQIPQKASLLHHPLASPPPIDPLFASNFFVHLNWLQNQCHTPSHYHNQWWRVFESQHLFEVSGIDRF